MTNHLLRLTTAALLAVLLSASGPTTAGDETPPENDGPPEHTNTLRWSTASEVNNFGFDVYRSTTKDGKYKRMTKKPIPGAGTIDTPTRYMWVDETIDPTQEYWYYVESISMDGHREPFTPKIRAIAKLQPDDETDPETDP